MERKNNGLLKQQMDFIFNEEFFEMDSSFFEMESFTMELSKNYLKNTKLHQEIALKKYFIEEFTINDNEDYSKSIIECAISLQKRFGNIY